MTSRSYFDKMNITLGSVVPLAMFSSIFGPGPCLDPGVVGVVLLLVLLLPYLLLL